MMRWTLALTVTLAVTLSLAAGRGTPVRAQEKGGSMGPRAVVQTPEWKRLTSLVGQWEGWFESEGKKQQGRAEVRMTADGSAMMHVMARDTPHEMVTMFHPDGSRLLATHYCAAHNQPRMALVPTSGPNQLAFDFVDGTNIGPGDGHMQRLVITFIDDDHHDEAWSYIDKGTVGPAMVIHYTRVK